MLSSDLKEQRQRDSLAFLGALIAHALVGLALLPGLQPQPRSHPLRLVELYPENASPDPLILDSQSLDALLPRSSSPSLFAQADTQPPDISPLRVPALPASVSPAPLLSPLLESSLSPVRPPGWQLPPPAAPPPRSLPADPLPPLDPEVEPPPSPRSVFPGDGLPEPPRPATTVFPRPVAPSPPSSPPMTADDFQAQLGAWLTAARQDYDPGLIPRRIDLKPPYPASACPDRLQGLALIPVLVDPDGQPLPVPTSTPAWAQAQTNQTALVEDFPEATAALLQSTGHPRLDQVALQTVNRYQFEATGRYQAILFVLNFRYAPEDCLGVEGEAPSLPQPNVNAIQ